MPHPTDPLTHPGNATRSTSSAHRDSSAPSRLREFALLATVLALVAGGGAAWWAGAGTAANIVWAAADAVTLVPAVVWVAADLRARRWGADLLAVLALAATVAVGEYLAGAIVAAMVATGRVLEAGAQRRASRNLTALLDRAPRVAHLRTAAADQAARTATRLLTEELLPHEQAEETELYPALARALGGPEGTVTMSREHAEIGRLARRLQRHLTEAPDGIQADQVDDLRATLYGLDAVLTLHFAQEEEAYFTLPSS
ncbi:hemerythrin domain-containing protein [Amycolatopsis balhimycina]|uniref:hemerythrin domain-containing protein n=1 Tax=Amycolatopsis balhimycina TaxID=208443 RepID=UPI000399EA8E|nr:hemerythrin domain-containing protein [Amycolatopsis balhimycina]